MKKRNVKRLTRLKIAEVSAADRSAAHGARVMPLKRVTGFDDTGGLLIDGVPRWRRRQAGGVTKADTSLERALQEIEDTKRLRKSLAAVKEDNMQTDIIKAMSDRVAEIKKADPSIRSDDHAMLRLSESRNMDDQRLWRSWKGGVVPGHTVGKAIDPEKAIRKMAKRVDQLMAADPSIRSRESGIAKVACSTDPDDQLLWQLYKHAGAGVGDAAALPHSGPAPVGKSLADIAFQNLCGALQASYPHLSTDQVRQWAEKILRGAPPPAALTQRTRDAA